MQREVEALALVVGRNAQANQKIDDLQGDSRADDAPQDDDDDALRLHRQLMGVAFEQAGNAGLAVRRR